jgi:GTP-binding protein Era
LSKVDNTKESNPSDQSKQRCGYVAVVGRPNAGKSSFLNWVVGEKIALVSHKANATRKRSNIIAMLEDADTQFVFIDTPGLHEREKLLNQFMLDEALKAIGDCDLILFLAPVTDKIVHYEDFLTKNKKNTPHIVMLTKTDFVSKAEVLDKLNEYEKYSDNYKQIIPISIKKGSYWKDILTALVPHMPVHPYLFDEEILTTEHLRDIFKEFIRESIFDNLSDELPYESDVMVTKIEEKPNIDVIEAKIIVDKTSQKGMIIGKGASTIKRIGQTARIKIEKLTQKKVYLELNVVIKKGWSKDSNELKKLGYLV